MNNPINSASWRARYIKRGGTEKGLRELYLMYERSFNGIEVIGDLTILHVLEE